MSVEFLAIFDFDGTLSDGRSCVLGAMRQAFAEQGQAAPPTAAVLATVGLRPVDAVPRLLPAAPPSLTETIAGRYRELVSRLARDRPELEQPFRGAGRCLEQLREEGITLAIVTGKTLEDLRQVLVRYGWEDRFASLHSSDQGAGKPDPEMIHAALRTSGLEPARAIMIGDTTYDIEMARRAGCPAIGVGWGFHSATALARAGATVQVDHMSELTGAVLSLAREARAKSE